MSTASERISAEELRLLKAMSVGQPVQLPSAHRLRLEMIGLLQDGPDGPRLTELGLRHARNALPEKHAAAQDAPKKAPIKRDRAGRRLPHGRALPFP